MTEIIIFPARRSELASARGRNPEGLLAATRTFKSAGLF